MRKNNVDLAVILGLAICSSTCAASTPPDVGSMLTQFQTASTNFGNVITSAAKWLAITLGTIDMSLMLLTKKLNGEGAQEMMVAVIMRVMWYGFLTFLMSVANMTALIMGFRQLGEQASGISILNPADIFWQGVDVVNLIMGRFSDSANIGGIPVPAGLAATLNPLVGILLALVVILIVMAFLVMTAQYAVILVQMYFFLACYPLVVSFGALKHGRDMSIKTISGAIVIGVKFLAIYFVLFAAQQMATSMEALLKNFSIIDLTPMWGVFAMSGLLAFLAMKVPQMAADLLNGTVSLSGGDAVAAGAAAGGAAAAIAGGTAALAGGAASSVGGALKAGSAAIDNAKASGASGMGGIAAGAMKALGSAGIESATAGIKGLGSGPSAGASIADRIGSRTASINEAKAAGAAPSSSVPGGQPAAPASPAASVASAPNRSTPSVPKSASQASAAPGTSGQHATSTSALGQGATERSTPPAPGTAATSTSEGRKIGAPDTASRLANSLVNELKQADSAQAPTVNIQAPSHD